MKTNLFLCISASLFSASLLFSCSGDGTERRIDKIVQSMTLEEKIGQMNQVSVGGESNTYIENIREGRIGSVLNEADPVKINEYQRLAVEESRLHIPVLFGRDVIHGFRTIFPIPLGMASTFDTEIVEQAARAAAREASAVGVRWTFSPMCDLARDSRWGRIAEGGGEDPLLTGEMAEAMVRGYQTDDPSSPDAIAACVKHYAGYGASEGGRDYNTANIPERQLRNFYLPPYEAAVKAGALTVMTSFNDIDGVPSTGNSVLLRDILRNEWGFNGFVVSDWNSIGEMAAHGFASDGADAARLAANAGCEMDMMSFAYITNLKKLVEGGKVKESVIDEAVKDILRVKIKLGLFDNPYVDTSLIAGAIYAPEALELAEKIAEESAVLLKNDDSILPLKASSIRRILVTGPMADAPREQLGTWSFDGQPERTVTPLDALKAEYGSSIDIVFFPALKNSRDDNPEAIAQAASLARKADVVLAFLGEDAILSGEAHCLADISLKGGQSRLLEALHESGKPVVTTIMAGRALCIGKELKNCDALLYSFHPGTMGGPAIASLLFGKAVPSGKLPVTFPNVSGEMWYYNHTNTGRPALGNEVTLSDIPDNPGQTSLGNTSFYLDTGTGPLFHFGFGLSYTDFRYGTVSMSSDVYAPGDSIRVSADVSNVGSVDAVETVQLYVRDLVGSTVRPVKELKAFRRVKIPAGTTTKVSFSIPVDDLAFYGLDKARKLESGEYKLWVAGDSDSGEPVDFRISEM